LLHKAISDQLKLQITLYRA